MALVEQLEFFPITEEERNSRRTEEVYARLENVRKGTFKRINGHDKMIMDHEARLSIIESHICKVGHKTKESYEERIEALEREIMKLKQMVGK